MKFLIKTTYAEPEYISGAQAWGTGESPNFSLIEPLRDEIIDLEKNIIKFRTGFHDNDIISNQQLSVEEREIYLKKATELREKIKEAYPESESNTNRAFWNEDRAKILLSNQTVSNVHDTEEDIEDAILFLNIIAGGFPSVSPNLEIAQRVGNKFYVTSEDEFVQKAYNEEYGSKRKAIGALNDFLEAKSNESLMWISYLLDDSVKGFTRQTSKETFEKTLMDFVEGKLSKTNKKGAAKKFMDLALLWKTDRETLIGKAVISAAINLNIIQKPKSNEGKLVNMLSGTELGSTQEQAYTKLMKGEYQIEFKELKDKVNKELSE